MSLWIIKLALDNTSNKVCKKANCKTGVLQFPSTVPSNFRPISTLSTLTQIFEKLVHKQSEKKQIMLQFQHGFKKGHSTVQAIGEIANTLEKAIYNNLYG